MRFESGNKSNNNNLYVSKLKSGHNGVNAQNGQNGVNSQNGQTRVNSQNGQNGGSEQNGVNGQHEINGKSKINGYSGVNRKNGVVYGNGNHEHNGQNRERNDSWTDSEEDSDIEIEPVSGSLVLKIVSEPPTTRKTPSKTSLADEDFGYASLEPTETYLQVQVQRSTSSSALCKPNCRDDLPQRSKSSSSVGGPRSAHCSDGSSSLGGRRSRHCSTGSQIGPSNGSNVMFGPCNGSNGSAYPIYNGSRYGSRSRQTSGATTRSGSISPTLSDSSTASSVNVTELMSALSRQASQMQHGIKELRDKVDNPYRENTPIVEDERIVLSGLNKQANISLKNIKNLYDETKYLKSYLEKLEANVHYDLTVKHKKPTSPTWWRKLAFLGLLGFAVAFIIYRRNPEKMTAQASLVGYKARDVILTFFTSSGRPVRTSVCLMGPGDM